MAKKRSSKAAVTKADVEKAQDNWAGAIVDIGHVYTTGGDVVACAKKHIDKLYGYDGTVLFKPTKCEQRQFRLTPEGALSYFVGDSLAPAGFSEDQGFAIAPFIDVKFMNADVIAEGSRAIAMGNYLFTTSDGQAIKVEYTFGYRRRGRDLVIDVHHSSLPFSHG